MRSRNYLNLVHSEFRWVQYNLRECRFTRAWMHYKKAWWYLWKAKKELCHEERLYLTRRFS